ncbi:glycosyltransferase family 4 protein [Cecembia calidifontis]|uniref:Glycosyltransferase involved in cell wall biosynthesis n=1 Tax=Cecembia calidifontis TaxID=1187080 RepID=A0A4Q7PDT3_9BACT|nr:glycosyltransferase family 4 protein [Cecembia calidifontis]RZS96982.1 glycosyltransferase involved in cell wall biosynthesis [Cecembia calidifontis]
MKKLILTHNDLSGYWVERLFFLQQYFLKIKIELIVVEIFGKGSPYDFQIQKKTHHWWYCIFPGLAPQDIDLNSIETEFFKKLDDLEPDYIIAGPPVFSAGALSLRWAKKNQVKIMIFDDANHSFYKRNFLVNFIKKRIFLQSDAFLIPSHDYDDEYLKWGVKKSSLYYGLSCINNARFSNSVPYKKRDNIILFVGRLVPIKNLQRLLGAWEIVLKNNSQYKLVLIGEGPEMQDLMNIVSDRKLLNVDFVGKKSNEELANILNNSKLLVLPSISESWGLVVNEAMASGLPVLSSKNVNAAHTLIKEGENGFVFDPYSEKEIAYYLNKFLELDEKVKEEFGQKSQKLVGKFNYEFLANEILRWLDDCSKKPAQNSDLLGSLLLKLWKGKTDMQSWNHLK